MTHILDWLVSPVVYFFIQLFLGVSDLL
jgi:hypothetical protein